MSILDLSSLSIRIDTENGPVAPVVDVSFAVGAGEVLALVGESGSGKSMTATAVLGLLPKRAVISGGVIRFRGAAITALSDEARRTLRGRGMAMVFQDPMQYLNPVMTCGDQVTEALRVLEGCASSLARERALDLFREVGLPDPAKHLRQYPHELSGGMRQRVLIAMMLALEPSLLIADEPTTALDATVQAQILTLLQTLAHKRGMALLLITHDLNAVARTADRAAVMQAGRIVETIAVADLFTSAQHPYTRMLVAALPKRGGVIGDRGAAETGAGGVPVGANVLTPASPPAPLLRAGDEGEGRGYRTLLTARDVTVAYPASTGLFGAGRLGEPVVKGVSLEVRSGETLAIVGESGSGKSTLGRALIRLGPVTSGNVIWEDGTDLLSLEGAALRDFRRRAQMVFQDPFASLNPRLSAGYQLAEPLGIHGIISEGGAAARVHELLDSVGLKPDDALKYPHQFSGGQRQRLAIARALAVSPRLVVADEPVSSLDMSVQGQVIELLQELGERLGLTYVFISHDLSVVERIADRVLVMHKGVIVEEGVTSEVFANPAHEYTRLLLEASFSTARL